MPWTPPTPADHLDRLRADVGAFAVLAPGALAPDVPSCPGWAVRDLVQHVGMVHGWCAENVRQLAPMRAQVDLTPPEDDEGLLGWAREQAATLVDVLTATDPDALMWTHVGGGAAAYWFRRMAHETGVHRLDLADALAAAGTPTDAVVAPVHAADGVDEFLHVYATKRDRHGRLRGAGERLVLRATDVDAAWLVRCEPDDGTVERLEDVADAPADAPTVTDTAEHLLRLVWNRGDASAATQSGPTAEAAIVLGRLALTAI